eukprot:1158730-Pelagomonas_calceolata.AAC.9
MEVLGRWCPAEGSVSVLAVARQHSRYGLIRLLDQTRSEREQSFSACRGTAEQPVWIDQKESSVSVLAVARQNSRFGLIRLVDQTRSEREQCSSACRGTAEQPAWIIRLGQKESSVSVLAVARQNSQHELISFDKFLNWIDQPSYSLQALRPSKPFATGFMLADQSSHSSQALRLSEPFATRPHCRFGLKGKANTGPTIKRLTKLHLPMRAAYLRTGPRGCAEEACWRGVLLKHKSSDEQVAFA